MKATGTAGAGNSQRLYERAKKVMAGGVSRNTIMRKPHPLYAAHAEGCRITDVDGVERIDFANNMTALIHGHAHPAVTEAVTKQLRHGTAYTLATEIELDYAEQLCARNPTFEQVRFVNSGTEAVMGALKAARAFTGRPKIAKVEGTYHGLYDFAEVSQTAAPSNWGSLDSPASVPVAQATPQSVLDDVVVIPFNDPERAHRILDCHGPEIACVLLDVMPHRAGLYPALPEFTATLQEWTRANGSLLVVDEVITFRNSFGGAQQDYQLTPDLTTLGKIIGGGLPVGAIAGRAEIMQLMNPYSDDYRMSYSGTFSANPITMTAGHVAMGLFDRNEVQRLNDLGEQARQGIASVIKSRGCDASVSGAGSLFRIHMQAEAPKDYRAGYPTEEQSNRLRQFFDHLLDDGILLIYSCAGSISTAMGQSEVEQLINAVDKALGRSEF